MIPIEADTKARARVLLATKQTEDSAVAQCASSGCPTAIQRTVTGTLLDGVRAHYRTVHPERKVN